MGLLRNFIRIGRRSAARVMAVAVLGLAFGLPTSARAGMITYTFTATGSGRLGANAFTDASFAITSTADTNQVTSTGEGFSVPDLTATIFVSGVGTATFTNPTTNIDNQPLGRAGISDSVPGTALLFEDNPAFLTYDLTTPIGPLTGSPSFNSGVHFATTAGDFSLRDVSTSTFRATTARAVPEPSSLALLGFGTAILAGWRRRKCGHALA
jgi:hypothetical protein